jgi:hypothetical protein
MPCSLPPPIASLSRTKAAAPVTAKDLWAVAGYAMFAGILLSPLRHYVGTPKQVKHKKFAHDSFPLSTYPMFSTDRKGRVTVPHVIGITADGQRVPLHYRHYGTGGLNQVRKQIARAVRRGDAAQIAQRYADALASPTRTLRRSEAAVQRVLVVRSRFSFDAYFDQDAPSTTPVRETIHAQCDVGGTAELLEARA